VLCIVLFKLLKGNNAKHELFLENSHLWEKLHVTAENTMPGAGSVVFTLNLPGDICIQQPNLAAG